MHELNKKYYKISEVTDILNIPASTLRFWEKQFSVIKPHRNSKGTRFYTPNDIEKIRMVHYLVKERGMKLEAAQQQITRNRTGIERKVEALDTLRSVRARLQTLIEALDTRRKRNAPQ